MTKKQELIVQMKKLSAQIGKAEIQRGMGQFISVKEIDRLKREFQKVSQEYKRLFFRKGGE